MKRHAGSTSQEPLCNLSSIIDMLRLITFSIFSFFCVSTVFAQNNSQGGVVPMDSISAAKIDSLLQADGLIQSEPKLTKWKDFHAKNCEVNIFMPENVSLQKDSTAFNSDSFIRSSIYQSGDYSEGASYTVMCYDFPASYPFEENAKTLLMLINQNLSKLDKARVISDDLINIYDSSGRQFVIKLGEGMSYYGRAVISDRSIISFVTSQVYDTDFTNPNLSKFFDSVELIESN